MLNLPVPQTSIRGITNIKGLPKDSSLPQSSNLIKDTRRQYPKANSHHTYRYAVLFSTLSLDDSYGRRHLVLSHDEFRGSRSGLCRSGGIGIIKNLRHELPHAYLNQERQHLDRGSQVVKVSDSG
ncbi:hypothetical protein TNCV_2602021 [Trichonephila clavipes]|nr:hypothetical protein TNCV_2602021 [Trichonephila clavipes]